MNKNLILSSISIIFVLFILFLLFVVKIGPVNHSKKDSIEVTGIIDSLYEGGVKDLVFQLENDVGIYYINRALENGFNLEDINKDLLGKEITLWHSKSRSNTSFHMLQLQHQDSVYYTEWQMPLARKN